MRSMFKGVDRVERVTLPGDLLEHDPEAIARDLRRELVVHGGADAIIELRNGDRLTLTIRESPSAPRTHWLVLVDFPNGKKLQETGEKGHFSRILPEFLRRCATPRPVVEL